MSPKLFWLLSGVVLAGCGSGQEDATLPPPPAPPAVSGNWYGYFLGTATLAGVDHYAEALLTADGAVHVHVSGPAGPEGSAQFVGRLATGGELSGAGEVFGQHCGQHPGPFCAAPAAADIRITHASPELLSGDIRVTMNAGTETWPFSMRWPTTIQSNHVIPALGAGQYQEMLAEFSAGEALTINVSGAGEMFFQSATTGCIGNGTLASHSSGTFLVYDATLTIAGCSGDYAYLNGEFAGLAARTMGDGPHDELGSWLLLWLSSRASTAPVAVTMWGDDLTCAGCWDY